MRADIVAPTATKRGGMRRSGGEKMTFRLTGGAKTQAANHRKWLIFLILGGFVALSICLVRPFRRFSFSLGCPVFSGEILGSLG